MRIQLAVLLAGLAATACFAQSETSSTKSTTTTSTTTKAGVKPAAAKTSVTKTSATKTAVTKTPAKSGAITGAQAVALVRNLPEVKAFLAQIRKVKRSDLGTTVELDRTENGVHVIHVYETVMDGPDSSHTATFNWYNVNAKTRKITKDF